MNEIQVAPEINIQVAVKKHSQNIVEKKYRKQDYFLGDIMRGTVKWFNDNKGYGFILDENKKEYFVHWKSILTVEKERKFLQDGEAVEFDVSTTDKGDQAINVVRLNI